MDDTFKHEKDDVLPETSGTFLPIKRNTDMEDTQMQKIKNKKRAIKISAMVLIVVLYLLIDTFLHRQSPGTGQLSTTDSNNINNNNNNNNSNSNTTVATEVSEKDTSIKKRKQLSGKFIHITDMHPDPYYVEGGSLESACHRVESVKSEGKHGKKKNKKKGRTGASLFGDAMAGCDSPPILVEQTLEYISKEFGSSEIDFIVWTGDNVRHDNDRKIPRTQSEIIKVNENISATLITKYSSNNGNSMDIPIIPSVGNNDVFPHNVLDIGPSQYMRTFNQIWNDFIPQEQHISFTKFMSFFQEIVPGKFAVVSINTMLLFKSNPMVDNCNDRDQPGFQLLTWFGLVLEEFRNKNMKIWISGHVPPISKNYETSCYLKFNLWCWEYRDVIVGGLYGHMNLDHFVPIDGKKLRKTIQQEANGRTVSALGRDEQNDDDDDDDMDMDSDDFIVRDEFAINGAKPVNKMKYINTLEEHYKKISTKLNKRKGKGLGSMEKQHDEEELVEALKMNNERYMVINVATSIIPTFNPGFRVWEYNITGLYDDEDFAETTESTTSWNEIFLKIDKQLEDIVNEVAEDEGEEIESMIGSLKKNKKKNKKKKKKKKKDKSLPKKMPKGLALGPAYTSQLFSPTSYTQYYLDLSKYNKAYYESQKDGKGKAPPMKYEVEYTFEDTGMQSLLVDGYLKYTCELADNKKSWKKYLSRIFALTDYENLDEA